MSSTSPKQKHQLKQKVLLFYEKVFDENGAKLDDSFWQEFFLLWANTGRIEEICRKLTGNQVLLAKNRTGALSERCIDVVCEHNDIRVVNAIRTLTAVTRGLASRSGTVRFDVIDALFGIDKAEQLTKRLLDRLSEFLSGDDIAGVLKRLSLDACVSMASACDSLAENSLLEYFLNNSSIFESIAQLLANSASRRLYGEQAVLLLTLLVNYRKYDTVNPYIVKLSILDDEFALHGFSNAIASTLATHNNKFQTHLSQGESKGMLSTVTNMVGSMFVADTAALNGVKSDDRLLLAMYEAVHLNRNFITTLTSLPDSLTEIKCHGAGENVTADIASCSENASVPSTDREANLFVAFLTYCSVVMQDLRSERTQDAAKLCFIILTCISEDQYANSVMHDVNMAFRIPLYKAPMRHRRGTFDNSRPLKPLIVTVLDLLCEFLTSHLMKQLPYEHYMWCLGVVHRILCYQKRCKVRLHYNWRTLWTALISLIRFLVQHESLLSKSVDIFSLSQRVVVILNVFITFGDTFLPDPLTYDHLYYELIRQRDAFDNLYALALRYVNEGHSYRDSAGKLGNQLVNVRFIVSHLQPMISQIGQGTLTEEQVLEVVRSSYESLTLKLYEYLDVFERYQERPRQTAFFANLVKLIVQDTRQSLHLQQLNQADVLNELSTIR